MVVTTLDIVLEKSSIKETDIFYHEQIGHGGGGEVFRITWKRGGGDKEAAAKKIRLPSDETHIQQLKFEIQVAQNFTHENVIKYYGHIITETHVILVMEYAAKGSLSRYLKALRKKDPRSQLTSEQIHTWAKQAAKAIQYLRKANLVHRDVKSPNLLIMEDGTLKLCDFGLAKYMPETVITQQSRGTAKWMAPEVWKEQKVNSKADVFAFGIVLWELITGEEPYAEMGREHILFSVACGKRPDIPNRCPHVYRTMMKQCWEEDRNKRPTIDDIVARLDGPGEIFGFPPEAPKNLTASSSNSTNLRVSWALPDDLGESPLIGYELEYRVLNSENGWLKVRLITTTSFTMSGMKAGSTYEVRVTAVNKAGNGPTSEPVIAVTDGTSSVYYILIAFLILFVAYIIRSTIYLEDFSAKHSWVLVDHFAHRPEKAGYLEGAQSQTRNPANGDIAVADWFTRKVFIYDYSGGLKGSLHVSEHPQIGKKSHPRDVAVSFNDTFYVTNETPYIQVFNSSYDFTHFIESSHLAGDYSRLSGLVFTNNGHLMVGECRHTSISVHSVPDGTRYDTFTIDVAPRYLAMTPMDTLVVSSWKPDTVQIISFTGEVLHTLKPPYEVTKWRPTGVSCSDDFIFVGNDDSTAPQEYGIYCYSLSGEYLGIATKDVVNPTGVEVSSDSSVLAVSQWERGNPLEGRGLHGVKVFTKKIFDYKTIRDK